MSTYRLEKFLAPALGRRRRRQPERHVAGTRHSEEPPHRRLSRSDRAGQSALSGDRRRPRGQVARRPAADPRSARDRGAGRIGAGDRRGGRRQGRAGRDHHHRRTRARPGLARRSLRGVGARDTACGSSARTASACCRRRRSSMPASPPACRAPAISRWSRSRARSRPACSNGRPRTASAFPASSRSATSIDVDFGDLLDYFALDRAHARDPALHRIDQTSAQVHVGGARRRARPSRSSSSSPAATRSAPRRRRRTPARSPARTRSTTPRSAAPACCASSTSTNCSTPPRRSAASSRSPATGSRSSPMAAASACSRSTGSPISAARSRRSRRRPATARRTRCRRSGRAPIRSTSSATPTPRRYAAALEPLLQDPDNDAVLVMNVPTALRLRDDAARSGGGRSSASIARTPYRPKPVFAVWVGSSDRGHADLRGRRHSELHDRDRRGARLHASGALPRGARGPDGDAAEPAGGFRARRRGGAREHRGRARARPHLARSGRDHRAARRLRHSGRAGALARDARGGRRRGRAVPRAGTTRRGQDLLARHRPQVGGRRRACSTSPATPRSRSRRADMLARARAARPDARDRRRHRASDDPAPQGARTDRRASPTIRPSVRSSCSAAAARRSRSSTTRRWRCRRSISTLARDLIARTRVSRLLKAYRDVPRGRHRRGRADAGQAGAARRRRSGSPRTRSQSAARRRDRRDRGRRPRSRSRRWRPRRAGRAAIRASRSGPIRRNGNDTSR